MKGDTKVMKALNTALKGEMMAINQYIVHSRLLESWGLRKIAKHEYKESIEEMGHADLHIQRIIMLGSVPNLQDMGKLLIGKNVKEVLENDLVLERQGIADYRAGIRICEEAGDYVTRDLFLQILKDEEGHEGHLETELALIEQMGLPNYIQMQAAEGGDE